jgi:hypothetical protein
VDPQAKQQCPDRYNHNKNESSPALSLIFHFSQEYFRKPKKRSNDTVREYRTRVSSRSGVEAISRKSRRRCFSRRNGFSIDGGFFGDSRRLGDLFFNSGAGFSPPLNGKDGNSKVYSSGRGKQTTRRFDSAFQIEPISDGKKQSLLFFLVNVFGARMEEDDEAAFHTTRSG